MNRIKSINLLIVLGLSLAFFQSCADKERNNPLDPGADNFGTATVVRTGVLSEFFETYGAGTIPTTVNISPWKHAIENSLTLDLTPALGINLSTTLDMRNPVTTSGNSYIYNDQNPLKGRYEIEFFIKNPAAPSVPNHYFASFDLIGSGYALSLLKVGVDENAKFFWNASGTGAAAGNFESSIWYQIKIAVNTETKIFSAWYKQKDSGSYILLADNVPVPGLISPVPGYSFHYQSKATSPEEKVYFDNLTITKVDFVK